MTELRRKKTASILWLLHLQLSLPIDEACYHIFHLFLLYIHPFPALSPFNPWQTHWVLYDFLCAKLASPDDIGKYRDAISGENSNGCSANFLLKFLAVVICLGLLFYAQRKV